MKEFQKINNIILLIDEINIKEILSFIYFLKKINNILLKIEIDNILSIIFHDFIDLDWYEDKIYKIKKWKKYIEIDSNFRKGGLYRLYKKSSIKQRYKNFIIPKNEYEESVYYRYFFLDKKSKLKKYLVIASKRRKQEDEWCFEKYKDIASKLLYNVIFHWPFLITIKPYIIIIRNIFFRNYFTITKKKEKLRYREFKTRKITSLLYKGGIIFWLFFSKFYFLKIAKKFIENEKSLLFFTTYKKYKIKAWNKLTKRNYYRTIKKYKKSLNLSFFNSSFFFQFYSLYLFWFLYYYDKLYYYYNNIIFNIWCRNYYFLLMFNNKNNNYFYYYFKKLYNKINLLYSFKNYLEIENNIISILSKFKISLFFNSNNIYCLHYFNIYNNLSIIIYNNYYYYYMCNQIFYNYFKFFKNNINKILNNKIDFFDIYYSKIYQYKDIYRLKRFIMSKNMLPKQRYKKKHKFISKRLALI